MATKTRVRNPDAVYGEGQALDALREIGRPLGVDADLDVLIDRVGDARIVMLGEASHGTSEFYTWRHRISERLIREKDFRFVAVEGDWPDCYVVNRFIRSLGEAATPREALLVFERWPTWMWANEEVVALVHRLRKLNDARPPAERVAFYGLDVYSLWDSLHAVRAYAEKNWPAALDRVHNAYRCFEPFADVEEYARAASWGLDGCEDEVAAMLAELRSRRPPAAASDAEAAFDAEQNSLVVRNAENYYRTMMRGGGGSWNVRDRHMAETLDRLLDRHGQQSKAIVWEHNTHIGDARATDMAHAGMINIGQLARERHARGEVVLVGFGSHRGSVIAGDRWEAPLEKMTVPEARAGSWEDLMHRAFGGEDQLLVFSGSDEEPLHERRGHRAIGVVYHPSSESGNYVPTDLANRYDAFLHLDETTAVHPLHIPIDWQREIREEPETYPTGM